MATSHRSLRHVFGAALAGARDVELRDAATDPVPEHRLGATRVIIGATGVAAAVALSWSLNLEPGQALFYPATFLVGFLDELIPAEPTLDASGTPARSR